MSVGVGAGGANVQGKPLGSVLEKVFLGSDGDEMSCVPVIFANLQLTVGQSNLQIDIHEHHIDEERMLVAVKD